MHGYHPHDTPYKPTEAMSCSTWRVKARDPRTTTANSFVCCSPVQPLEMRILAMTALHPVLQRAACCAKTGGFLGRVRYSEGLGLDSLSLGLGRSESSLARLKAQWKAVEVEAIVVITCIVIVAAETVIRTTKGESWKKDDGIAPWRSAACTVVTRSHPVSSHPTRRHACHREPRNNTHHNMKGIICTGIASNEMAGINADATVAVVVLQATTDRTFAQVR